MPTEQRFWDYLMSSSLEWGLKVYEQDWLYNEFSEMNCKFEREAREFKPLTSNTNTGTLESATLARQWLVQMGTAAGAKRYYDSILHELASTRMQSIGLKQ